jgi:type II secretory pathway pseudopilin PulG
MKKPTDYPRYAIAVMLMAISTLLLFGVLYLYTQNQVLRAELKGQAGIQKLAEDNQSIAKQNRAYSRCIAQVFAKYTRDHLPVTNLNLDTCTTDSQTKATDDSASGGTTPAQSNADETKKPKSTKPAPKPITPADPVTKIVCDDKTVLFITIHLNCREVSL